MGACRTYRGRVISLEAAHGFAGFGGAVKVHRLRSVPREDVILPEKRCGFSIETSADLSPRESELRHSISRPRKDFYFTGRPVRARPIRFTTLHRNYPDTRPCW